MRTPLVSEVGEERVLDASVCVVTCGCGLTVVFPRPPSSSLHGLEAGILGGKVDPCFRASLGSALGNKCCMALISGASSRRKSSLVPVV